MVAPEAVDADALAKACCVLEPEQSLRLIQSLPDTECLIVMASGELKKSNGWPRLESLPLVALGAAENPQAQGKPGGGIAPRKKTRKRPTKKARPAVAWNKELERADQLRDQQPGKRRRGRRRGKGNTRAWARRPGWAIPQALRGRMGRGRRRSPGADALALGLVRWRGPFQWLPDLKRWYQADQERKRNEKKEILFSVSRPTRPPGKYKVIWDGKDNNGKQLAGGEYTITIEAAREHGTYQSIRKEVVIEGKPFTEELKGNVEIKSASIEYRRKPAAKE